MGALDAPLAGVAKTLLGTFGRSATLYRAGTPGEYNTATGAIEGDSTPAGYPCEIAFSDYADSQIDGTVIKVGDRKAIVSRLRLGITPLAQSDTIAEGGRTWQIINVRGYSTGAQEAAYQMQLRR